MAVLKKRSHVTTEQKPTGRATTTLMMSSAGMLALLFTFAAFKPMQAKIYLIETEAEPMPKEEVAMVLHALPHKVERAYNTLSKSVQEKIQKILLKLYGDDSEAVGYVYTIYHCCGCVSLQLFKKQHNHLQMIKAALEGSLGNLLELLTSG